MATRRTPTGLTVRHSRACREAAGGDPCRCDPGPSYEAWVWSKRDGTKISRRFSGKGALAAAKSWRADATHALGRGRLRQATRSTVREAAEALILGMYDGSVRSSRRRPYKPSTVRSYERALGLEFVRGEGGEPDRVAVKLEQRERAPERILERLGDVRLADLDRHAVQEYVERLLSAGYDASTVHNQLDPLRVIYRRARDRDEVTVDPTERLDLPTPQGRRNRVERMASAAEAAALIAALPLEDRALWATAFYSGLRRGELRALRWRDVDLREKLIRVERSWDDVEGELGDGKTDAARRVVPIVEVLVPELRGLQMRSGRRGVQLVFGTTGADEDGKDIEIPFEPTTVRRRALVAWGAAKLEPITPHDARHTFASLLIAAGVDAKAISEYMGHSTITITFDRYGHKFENARDQARTLVDAFLSAEAATVAPLREVT